MARRFNSTFGETFVVPEAIVQEVGARIMSLQDPTAKMSKSDPTQLGTIFLNDDADAIRKKISKAVTENTLVRNSTIDTATPARMDHEATK